MTLPKLYSRTSHGQIQEWEIHVNGNSFYSVEGLQGGQATKSAPTVCEPKNVGRANETTADQQAKLEAQAKWDKKIKKGYHQNVADIDKEGFFEPMLAKNFGDYKDKIDWVKGVGVQIKFNGGRIIARKNGLFTRTGERYVSIPHIEQALVPFFNKFPDAVLDGEGFNYGLRERLCEIMSILRTEKPSKLTPQFLQNSKDIVRFYIYDGYGFGATAEDGYLKRKAAIDNAFFAPCFAPRYKDIIHKVKTWIVKSEAELEALYQTFLADKQEGAILRILNEAYQNKRTQFLLKYKPLDDAEFKFIKIEEGDGKFANRVATITCQRIDGKKYLDGTDTFRATFKGTEKDAVAMWKVANTFINKVGTIYYNGVTGYGKPNYARFDFDNWRKS